MTHDSPRLSRRTLLAGLGTVGLVATGPGVVRALRGQPPYANYTYAQTTEDGPDLRVAWYETYNGEYREDSNRFTDGEKLENTSDSFNESATAERFVDRTGPNQVDAPPVVDLPNVHPGDSGTLVLGLLAENADARVWLRLAAAEFRENRLTEPEIVDADTTDDVFGSDGSLVTGGGELQEYVDVRLWYDTGVLDTGMVVGCNGVYDAAVESLVALPETSASPRADGTLTDLSADAALGEGAASTSAFSTTAVFPWVASAVSGWSGGSRPTWATSSRPTRSRSRSSSASPPATTRTIRSTTRPPRPEATNERGTEGLPAGASRRTDGDGCGRIAHRRRHRLVPARYGARAGERNGWDGRARRARRDRRRRKHDSRLRRRRPRRRRSRRALCQSRGRFESRVDVDPTLRRRKRRVRPVRPRRGSDDHRRERLRRRRDRQRLALRRPYGRRLRRPIAVRGRPRGRERSRTPRGRRRRDLSRPDAVAAVRPDQAAIEDVRGANLRLGFDAVAEQTRHVVASNPFTSACTVPPCEPPVESKDEPAISFLAFCADGGVDGGDVTLTVASWKDGDPYVVDWTSTVPVDTVIVKAGDGGQRYDVGGATSGTVSADGGTPGSVTPSAPCPDGSAGVKFDWNGGGWDDDSTGRKPGSGRPDAGDDDSDESGGPSAPGGPSDPGGGPKR
ncbi:hypothetical protein ACFQJD_10785 [Haloplanus sp. GCM10025708]|uniref:hypothetical protein n=1 Tax=Haloplanus sp. GCM10025708 TaxID=3252679 RepID=UPI00361B9031